LVSRRRRPSGILKLVAVVALSFMVYPQCVAVRGLVCLAIQPFFVSFKWLACCKVYSFAIVCTGQVNLIFAIVTAASLCLPKFVLL
jgi:hypothetical protein